MRIGDSIYYFDAEDSGWPGTVLEIKKRVKIRFNHYDGDKTRWVSRDKLELQDLGRRIEDAGQTLGIAGE